MIFRFSWKQIWEELVLDIFYSNDKIVSELIDDALKKLNIIIEIYSNNKLLDTIQPDHKSDILTKIPIHIDQESCGFIASQDETISDQVKLLHLWCLLGLDTYYKKTSKRTFNQSLRYFLISSSTSELEIDYFLLKSFLRNLKLPLPQRLYPQEQDNTQNIFIALVKTPNQQIHILKDIRGLLAEKYILLKESSVNQYTFCLEGDFIYIRFGNESCLLRKTKGLSYLKNLIRRQLEEISVSDLYCETDKIPYNLINEDYSNLSKDQLDDDNLRIRAYDSVSDGFSINYREEIKDKLKELRDELFEAKKFNEHNRVQDLSKRINMAEKYLRARRGKIGSTEKERKAVFKNIKTAIDKINEKCPHLALHLKNSISTGTTCCYRPENPIGWLVI
jgi:hypothetical protein